MNTNNLQTDTVLLVDFDHMIRQGKYNSEKIYKIAQTVTYLAKSQGNQVQCIGIVYFG
jgi:hypothetical protein